MNLEYFLNDVAKWQDVTFPSADPLSKLMHLREEIDELMEAFLYSFSPIPYVKNADIREEYADCFLLLYGSALKAGFTLDDIYQAMREKMELNKKRKWGEADENGVIKHL